MSYDLAAMRSHFLFLVRDPNGDQFANNNDIRDSYLNPAYLAWWRRNERRPGNLLTTITTTEDQGTDYFQTQVAAPGPDVVPLIEHVVYRISSGRWLGLKRSDHDRMHFMQDSEGTAAQMEEYGVRLAHLDTGGAFPSGISSSPWLELLWYPIPLGGPYTIDVYATVQPALLVNDSDKVALDPVSARMVTRLGAYRAAVDLELEPQRAAAIIAPVDAWARQKRAFDAALHGMPEMAA